jgi:hypothetical protein
MLTVHDQKVCTAIEFRYSASTSVYARLLPVVAEVLGLHVGDEQRVVVAPRGHGHAVDRAQRERVLVPGYLQTTSGSNR